MHTGSFEALGTTFRLTVWDDIADGQFERSLAECRAIAEGFDQRYSRFKEDSLVTALSAQAGVVEVPHELVAMLRLYAALNEATAGAINPAIGFALEDTGYDSAYSLRERDTVRDVPELDRALAILDDTHIQLREPVLLDLGALGKGYVVDVLHEHLRSAGLARFLVDGSGDIRYHSEAGEPIVCGLEHPHDPTQVIGTIAVTGGSLCASATNRRAWGRRNHYLHPGTKESPQDIIATWVTAETAALADGLSSALFFVPPEALAHVPFEYCVVNSARERKNSAGFAAEFF